MMSFSTRRCHSASVVVLTVPFFLLGSFYISWRGCLELDNDRIQYENGSFNDGIIHDATGSRHPCARWIPTENRKVLFVDIPTMDTFKGTKENITENLLSFKTGEFYMSATWDYALKSNGFEVHETRWDDFEVMNLEELHSYHRIVVGCLYYDWDACPWGKSDRVGLRKAVRRLKPIRCKMRLLYWWEHDEDAIPDFLGAQFLKPEQILTPYFYNKKNTHLGYFPHNLLETKHLEPKAERERMGLILGKDAAFILNEETLKTLEVLLDHNFTLHATCRDGNYSMLPNRVINHRNLSPGDYASLTRQAAFILGTGYPITSPSPIVGMSLGAAFINPAQENGDSQHPPLAHLKPPYLYNVNLTDAQEVLRAAESSVTHRFSSYVPADFRVQSTIDRVCAMLENESPCI